MDVLLDGRATLFLSEDVLAEPADVIQREKFRARLEQRGQSASLIVSNFHAAAVVVEPAEIIVPASLRDPDDVHVLACAASAEADAIVSGDKDLLVLGSFQGIPIIEIKEALRRLGLAAE